MVAQFPVTGNKPPSHTVSAEAPADAPLTTIDRARNFAAHPEQYAPIIAPPVEKRSAWVGGIECRTITYQSACYACYVAAGVPWPAGMVENPCDQHFAPCPSCRGFGGECAHCGNLGEILPRNLMAHRFLSSPGAAGNHSNDLIGFVLPIAENTDDAYWLAQAIEATRDHDDLPLSCEQLLIVFDYLTTWAATYEPTECYWRLAGEKVITLIGVQLREALPDGCL